MKPKLQILPGKNSPKDSIIKHMDGKLIHYKEDSTSPAPGMEVMASLMKEKSHTVKSKRMKRSFAHLNKAKEIAHILKLIM